MEGGRKSYFQLGERGLTHHAEQPTVPHAEADDSHKDQAASMPTGVGEYL